MLIGGPGGALTPRDLVDRIGVNMQHPTLAPFAATKKRFWAKVDKRGPDECWPWKAYIDRYGYGSFRPGGTASSMAASRFSWILANPKMAITSDFHVCHACDNRACVNPGHLFVGTALENVRDRISKRRFTKRPYAPRSRRAAARVALAKVPKQMTLPSVVNLATFAPKPLVAKVKPGCEVAACERTVEGRSTMCRMHKRRFEKHGDTNARRMGKPQVPRSAEVVRRKIAAKVVAAASGCWEWQGGLTVQGYASLAWGSLSPGHRVSYELYVGPIPDGLFVCHHCDNRKCVNPDHLFVGTAAENHADMMAKGRGRNGSDNPLVRKVMRESARKRAKPNEEQVTYIRSSTERGVDLAQRFGVAQQTICNIRKGRRWPTTTAA